MCVCVCLCVLSGRGDGAELWEGGVTVSYLGQRAACEGGGTGSLGI